MPERFTEKRAANVIHEIMQQPEHVDSDYAAHDKRLKIAAMFGVVLVVFGLILGDQINSPKTVGIGVVLGILVFGVALFKASGNYKRAYRKFVTRHMADDGTFGFCPSCKSRQPIDEHDQGPRTCRSCGAALWRFEQPETLRGNPKQAARRQRAIDQEQP